jgi:preprotein translocase subunit SecA
MRLFGGDRMDRIKAMMERYNLPSDEPIQAKMVSKAVEGAQRKVEEINFAMRKNVLDYDDVMNKQRQVIYEERNKVLDGKDLTGHIDEVMHSTVERAVNTYCSTEISTSDWDFVGLNAWIRDLTGSDELPEYPEKAKHDQIVEIVYDHLHKAYEAKAEVMGAEILSEIANQVMLRVIDTRWMAYLQEMDYLKTGIGLRGFGQRDPLVEYKAEAYAAFGELVGTMYEDFLRTILRIQLAVRQPEAPTPAAGPGDASSDDEPAALQGAHYSGPADVDGDQGERSALRAAARLYGPAGKGAEVPPVPDIPPVGPDGRKPSAAQIAQWREARSRYEREQGQQSPGAPAEKPRTYRKDEDPNPYVGIGRNEPCPCGSGKKFKNCHGRNPMR